MAFPDLPFPTSRAEIAGRNRERKRLAVARARQSAFFRGRLDHIDLDRLDRAEEWLKIPVMTKDQLRALEPARFHEDFCIGPRSAAIEFWRSGGATGRPLFYPRSVEDMHYGLEGFRRLLLAAGLGPGDLMHVSFPLGIHPVGMLYARAANALGIGVVTCGAGSNTPSALQLELIDTLRPTAVAGMASYLLQLGQNAERAGIDLASSTVTKLLTAAEPVSLGKRERLERIWGVRLFDQFGCTEGTAMASESECHDGMHIWTDMYEIEVVDETTHEPVAEGEMGLLVFTPLWNNTITPFLRWDSGDYVRYVERGRTEGRFSVFPMIRHAARTAGFFKVRGININQADIEDFLYRQDGVSDFKVEAVETETLDSLVVSVELAQGHEPVSVGEALSAAIKRTFELTPEVTIIEPGTLEREFVGQIKQNRFVDRRGTPA